MVVPVVRASLQDLGSGGPSEPPAASRLPRLFRLRDWLIASAWCASVAFGLGATGHAAPYCLTIVGLPNQCIYADVADCRREAQHQRGVCNVNKREVELPKIPAGRFCLVTNGPAIQCSYADRRTCEAEATRRSAICADSAPAGTPDVDIFRQQ